MKQPLTELKFNPNREIVEFLLTALSSKVNPNFKEELREIVLKNIHLRSTENMSDIIQTMFNVQDFKTEMVKEFSLTFGQEVNSKLTTGTIQGGYLKHRLMKEELEEYLEAIEDGNIVEIADAIGDMQYILDGIKLYHGLEKLFPSIFLEIHNSNMSKLQDGKVIRRKDGKILKGKDYFKPNLERILKQ